MNSSSILYKIVLFLLLISFSVTIQAISANSSDGPPFPGEADFVHSLPNVFLPVGQNYSSVRHYSGYLLTSPHLDSTNVPYWFFESQSEKDWQSQPVVLWFGGYVSAMHAALIGISPIRMNVNGTLSLNQYAWNKQANLLIFDPFPDVGIPNLNYTELIVNDTVAAEFAFEVIEKFYEKFPQISENSFYIAGEGLVSFHIGILAKKFVEKRFPRNFKGILLGNGVYNMSAAVNAHFQFIYEMKQDLYGNEFWNNLENLCCPREACSFGSSDYQCTFQNCQTFINIYNIYNITKEVTEQNSEPQSELCNKFYKKFYAERYEKYFTVPLPLDLHNIHEKCLSDVANATCARYIITKKIFDWFNLNSKPVLEALHIEDYTPYGLAWQPADSIYNRELLRQYPILHGHLMFLLRNNIRVLLYTGELDGVVSPFNTKWLLKELPLEPISYREHKDWMHDTKKLGYRTRFCGGLTFYSITGAGHTVPEDQPATALQMFTEFLLEDHDHSETNSVNHWASDCPQTDVPSCSPFCSTEPVAVFNDGFAEFRLNSLYRYYAYYKI